MARSTRKLVVCLRNEGYEVSLERRKICLLGLREIEWVIRGLRLISVDGSTMEIADEAANDQAFGRPGASRGESAFPQLRFVSLVENGTHVLFGTRQAPYAMGEVTLATALLAPNKRLATRVAKPAAHRVAGARAARRTRDARKQVCRAE